MTGTRTDNTDNSVDLLPHYFPDLTERQMQQYREMFPLYADWNEKINVISRKDIDHLYVHHVLHSLAIAKLIRFEPGCRILDVGTGGGFPGIPLAVMFPDAEFHLVDSIGKKIKVVQAVADGLGLRNVRAEQCRAETLHGSYDFIVSRAVTRLPEFYGWVSGLVSKKNRHALPNGILYLKGGDLADELRPFGRRISEYEINALYGLSACQGEPEAADDREPAVFFETKKVIHLAF